MDLHGFSSIVTGGSSGLGAAVVRTLEAQGCAVVVLDRDPLVSGSGSGSGSTLGLACDVSDEASVADAVAETTRRHGPARIIVNCAGVGDNGRVLGRNGVLPLAAFRRVLDINVAGTFNVIRLAMAELAKAPELPGFGRGVIVNTSSIAAFDGQTGQAAYAASKAAVVGLTLPLAREFARLAVRVMTICPGVFHTPMVDAHVSAQVLDGLLAHGAYPKRAGDPAEFAELVLAIVRNPMLNGEVIRLDGGLRMPAF